MQKNPISTKDGKISKYERKRGMAIAKNMSKGGMVELQARGCGRHDEQSTQNNAGSALTGGSSYVKKD